MSDSTTLLDLLTALQTGKDDTVNALFDAMSTAALFGRRASTTTGLTWGYYGGRYDSNTVANGTLTLTASTTNYVVADRATGAVSVSLASTNWDNNDDYIRCYKIVTGVSTVTSYEDHRQTLRASGGGGSGSPSLPLVEFDYSSEFESVEFGPSEDEYT